MQRCQPHSLSWALFLPISLTRKRGPSTAATCIGNPSAIKTGGNTTEWEKSILQRKMPAQPSVLPLQRAWLPRACPCMGRAGVLFMHWRTGLVCRSSPEGQCHSAAPFPLLEAVSCVCPYSRWDAEAKRWARWKMNSYWEQLSMVQKGTKPCWWHSQLPLTPVFPPGLLGRAPCFPPTLFSCHSNAGADLVVCAAARLC